MAAAFEVSQSGDQHHTADFDAIYKLPRGWRYFNISVLGIFYYRSVIRLLHRSRIRHEFVTAASIVSGLAAAWIILGARSFADFIVAAALVHLKDLFDACDGALARLTGTGHRLGRFLDTIGDGVAFTAWIMACTLRGFSEETSAVTMTFWVLATWLSLFLQCSYFNFYQLHYIRLSGAGLSSRLDERSESATGAVAFLAWIYELWFGWQDRWVARLDQWQRRSAGLPVDSADRRNDDWYGRRPFMVANSALCFGTHAFVLTLCLLFQSPFWFLPVVTVGINLYWLGIVLARRVVFHKPA